MKTFLFFAGSFTLGFLTYCGMNNLGCTQFQAGFLLWVTTVFLIRASFSVFYKTSSILNMWFLPFFFLAISIGTFRWNGDLFHMVYVVAGFFAAGTIIIALLYGQSGIEKMRLKNLIEKRIEGRKNF